MALSGRTYADLQNAIADWMVRPDLTVAQIKDAIMMFEAEASRRLRVRDMEASSLLTTASGTATLPTDLAAWRGLTWNGSITQEVDYVHPTIFYGTFGTTEGGTPSWFTVEGSNIRIRPVDDTADAFTLRYWQKVPNLSAGSDSGTNWLLTAHPDFYLAGCLYQAYKFVRDPDAAIAYKNIMEENLQQIIDFSERTKEPAELRIIGTVV